MKPVIKNKRGFTLIELMIAMVIGLLIMGTIFQVYTTYQKADVTQRLVVDMLQNARAAMLLMEREIRMAGHAPAATDGQDNDGNSDIDDSDANNDYPGGFPGFVAAGKASIQFTMDYMPDPSWCKDGLNNDAATGDTDTDEFDECYANGNTTDLNEDIKYMLSGTDLMRDDGNDGEAAKVLAYDIEAIAFAYAYDSDDDRQLDTDGATPPNVIWAYDSTGDGNLDYDLTAGGSLGTPVPISAIRAVKIWLLARTASPIKDYTDTQTYSVGGQSLAKDDHYKRTLLTTTVYCRNTRF